MRIDVGNLLEQDVCCITVYLTVHCTNLCPVHRNQDLLIQIQLHTYFGEDLEHTLQRLRIIFSKIGDGPEVRDQTAKKKDNFQVSTTLAHQAATAANLVGVPIDVTF